MTVLGGSAVKIKCGVSLREPVCCAGSVSYTVIQDLQFNVHKYLLF